MVFNNVLILSASAGAGHVRAAQALEKAFALESAARAVSHVDALAYTNRLFRKLYADAYIKAISRAPGGPEVELPSASAARDHAGETADPAFDGGAGIKVRIRPCQLTAVRSVRRVGREGW